MGVHSEILQIDPVAGTFRQLTDGTHGIPSYPAPAFSYEPRTERLAFLFDEPTRFGDVYTFPLAGGQLSRVTTVYDSFDATFALPRQERFTWKGADGAAVEGLLFYPADFERGKRYPLVVQLHGGPAESDKYGAGSGFFQGYFPVLTGKGYVVLRPNYRGSAGYGNDAYRDVVGHYFRNQPLDVLTAVDTLIAQGIADPDQMVLMGWSAGAHLTNKLITMTSRFKAASSGAGVANWVSMYAQTDDRFRRFVWFGGSPWQKNAPIDEYWNSSPIKDIANATTPTLLFVGDSDPRVPMAQSIEMYQALKSLGVPTRLVVAPREGHQWGELRHLLSKANDELAWFEKYARGRSYTPDKSP
jgi:dipeptidyl aminopeptidase/acylaminoacyl peptidase